MALAEKQKHRILFLLGWTGKTLIPTSTHFNSVVNDRLINLNTEIEKLVKELLTCVETVDAQLKEALCRLSAKSVNGITTNPEEIRELKKERRRYVRELADHLDINMTKSSTNMANILV